LLLRYFRTKKCKKVVEVVDIYHFYHHIYHFQRIRNQLFTSKVVEVVIIWQKNTCSRVKAGVSA